MSKSQTKSSKLNRSQREEAERILDSLPLPTLRALLLALREYNGKPLDLKPRP